MENPKKHFVYQYHFAKELAKKLKQKNINFISSDDKELILRLKYYGIKKGNKYFISKKQIKNFDDIISIAYNHKVLYKVYIQKR